MLDLPLRKPYRAGSANLDFRDEKNPQYSSTVLIISLVRESNTSCRNGGFFSACGQMLWVAIRGLMISLLPLTMANLSNEPEKTLILSTEEVNADNITNKSLSRTVVQRSKPKKTVTETQHDEESVATNDTTKSLEASELAEKIANQPETIDAEKVERGITLTLAPKSAMALSKKKLLIKQGKVKLPGSFSFLVYGSVQWIRRIRRIPYGVSGMNQLQQ
ncbi:hypothetical protein Tco_0779401 [Tanacetum coccineum]